MFLRMRGINRASHSKKDNVKDSIMHLQKISGCLLKAVNLHSAISVFEQDGCVDWLRTATVYTKQTTGCPR